MSKTYEFIKECGTFFVLTENNECPMGRPFGAIMEYQDDLYVSTTDNKAVYEQLKKNPNVQILALKTGTRDWIRVSGIADECEDNKVKQRMLDECPVLAKHFPTVETPHYVVFRIKVLKEERY